jgi:hypothetical protein
VVVIVEGYPDPGLKAVFGCRFKEMGSTTSWARLIAASGMVAVAYTNERPEPDLHGKVVGERLTDRRRQDLDEPESRRDGGHLADQLGCSGMACFTGWRPRGSRCQSVGHADSFGRVVR